MARGRLEPGVRPGEVRADPHHGARPGEHEPAAPVPAAPRADQAQPAAAADRALLVVGQPGDVQPAAAVLGDPELAHPDRPGDGACGAGPGGVEAAEPDAPRDPLVHRHEPGAARPGGGVGQELGARAEAARRPGGRRVEVAARERALPQRAMAVAVAQVGRVPSTSASAGCAAQFGSSSRIVRVSGGPASGMRCSSCPVRAADVERVQRSWPSGVSSIAAMLYHSAVPTTAGALSGPSPPSAEISTNVAHEVPTLPRGRDDQPVGAAQDPRWPSPAG